MSKILLHLSLAYPNAYELIHKKKFSDPKIYNASENILKRWYVYYSFRNPTTDKLERQTPIYAGVNLFKNVKERKKAILILCKAITEILEDGYNPYEENNLEIEEAKIFTINDAFDFVLEHKKRTLRDSSFADFKVRINSFKKWLIDKGFENRDINSITKKIVMDFLNGVLTRTSPKNRNNTRSMLSMFFQTLTDNDFVKDNFIKKINVLNSTPKRNKTYTSKQEVDILEYLIENDTLLLLFIQFISYNHLRPVEVVRLKVKDINIADKLIFVRAKNKAVKMKILPEILLKEMPELDKLDPETYLFTPKGIGFEWETSEMSKRAYFGERFRKVKDSLKLGEEYGLYSFRHTFITKLYKEIIKNSTPFEAKSKLMLITGHTTMTALEKYLRDIDAELPEDYSNLLQ
ncbi:tyrosine-type recombinase/integrase [Flavobacterium sp.]|uniref:tyrosine-type recombinase/integrase n=1 Tax=Flavobacterium sp. TaxID=239 RepID=UPI003750D619